MKFLEKNLENIIYNSDPEKIRERGLDIYSHDHVLQQVVLGHYGKLDLVGFNTYPEEKKVRVTVYELKLETVGMGTLTQALSYCKGIKESLLRISDAGWTIDFTVCLIGARVDIASHLKQFAEFSHFIHIYQYDYEFDGIHFWYRKLTDLEHQLPDFSVEEIEECIKVDWSTIPELSKERLPF